MLTPATYGDIEARWRPLTAAEQEIATTLLTDAWEILLQRVNGITARYDDGTISEKLLIATLCAMVLRVMRNPDGKRSETIDDYTWVRDNAVSAGLLYLSDDELAVLSPVGASVGAFTITPFGEPGYSTALDPWLDW